MTDATTVLRNICLLFSIALLSACTRLPAAKLQLVNVRLEGDGYAVTFDADIDFLAYYESERRFWPATNKRFICSPEQRPDFDDVNSEKPVAEGLMERVSARQVGTRMVYRYKAHLYFERFERSQFISIGANDVDQLLPPGAAMACKVRILVYFAPRYFSETLYLPNDPLKKLARQLAQDQAEGAEQPVHH